jgi:dTDP-4-amino-4,6-dideoxygalactose transaminase
MTTYCSSRFNTKGTLFDLALFGGAQTFDHPLHVGRPNLPDRARFHARIDEMLDRNWLSNDGPLVQELECRVAHRLGVRHCILTCNGTAGLEIMARAAGLRGEVIVPSFTFIATAHALRWQGITPVFCDIDPMTHTLDPNRIEDSITERTTAILGVHLWGQPCDTESLESIAQRYGLDVFYDAAHAFGCSHSGQMIGNFGRAEVFSLHATKVFQAAEGGAIVTNDDALAAKARVIRSFGFSGPDRVIDVGINGKMSEVSAAMGLCCLENLDEFIDVNRRNHNAYCEALCGVAGIRFYRHDETEKRNYQYIVLEVDSKETGIDRDALLRLLQSENILARRYFYPGCHRTEPYLSCSSSQLPETEYLAGRILQLPTGMAIGPAEIVRICDLLKFAVSHGAEIARRIEGGSALPDS